MDKKCMYDYLAKEEKIRFTYDRQEWLSFFRAYVLADGTMPMDAEHAWKYHCYLFHHITKSSTQFLFKLRDEYFINKTKDQKPTYHEHLHTLLGQHYAMISPILWTQESLLLGSENAEKFVDLPFSMDEIPRTPEHWIYPVPIGPAADDPMQYSFSPSFFLIPARRGQNLSGLSLVNVIFSLRNEDRGVVIEPILYAVQPTEIGETSAPKQDAQVTLPAWVRSLLFWKRQRRVVSTSAANLPRAERRRLKRQGITPEQGRSVQVVLLRKDDKVPVRKPGEKRDWQHRWLVRHHLRLITDKKTQQKRPVYVRDHLKGPEDKPFLPPKPVVQKVVR